MEIMKSQADSTIVLTELSGYRADANFTARLSRVYLGGETAWALNITSEITAEIRYFAELSAALNALTSVIRDRDEQKQLLRALI